MCLAWTVDRSTDHLLPLRCLSRKRCLGGTACDHLVVTNVGAADEHEQAWARRQVTAAAGGKVVLRPA